MKVHFIAIGGSAMHNLAIALHQKGYAVSGSDDEIFEPSHGRLASRGLLPANMGWDALRIHAGLDAVIVGMHARADNPELLRAKELELPVYSYPEYIFEQTRDKIRVVIGGSHGKTSITSMVLHVCQAVGVDTDYMVGAQLEGFDCMVKLTGDAPFAVLEGDEYLSSPIDRRPKFHLYKPHIALISGIAWDHINVFPTFENYVDQFRGFIQLIEPGGHLVYCREDADVNALAAEVSAGITLHPYGIHPHRIQNGVTLLQTTSGEVAVAVFGDHNLMNLNGALQVCRLMGIAAVDFYRHISSFKGASKRLELVRAGNNGAMYKDFAHSPSKLKATTAAVRRQFPERKLVACMELHTFSSLTPAFLKEYAGSMAEAHEAVVYFNPHTLHHKKLPPLQADAVRQYFGSDRLRVFTSSKELHNWLKNQSWQHTTLLMMSSGNFDGLDFTSLAVELGF